MPNIVVKFITGFIIIIRSSDAWRDTCFCFALFCFRMLFFCSKMAYISPIQELFSFEDQTNTKGAFFWDYSGIGILGIDGICVLLGAIPFPE